MIPSLEEIPEWVAKARTDLLVKMDDSPTQTPPPPLCMSSWKPFKIGDLFEIKRGKGLPKHDRKVGKTPYIGALDRNNGLAGYVADVALHPEGTLTLNWNGVGGVGVAYYQPNPYWCSGDVNALYPRFKMTATIAMFLITVIRKERYRYSFGRKLTLRRMVNAVIRLPVKGDGTPDWDFMDDYIKALNYASFL